MECRSLLKAQGILQRQLSAFNMNHIYRNIEMPLVYLLAEMEVNGLSIDLPGLNQLANKIKGEVKAIEADVQRVIQAHLGQPTSGILADHYDVNLASPEQVATLLYDTLGLPTPTQVKESASGHARSCPPAAKKRRHESTSEEDLNRIKHLHPIIAHILDFRTLNKFLNTYIQGVTPYETSFQLTPLLKPRATTSTSSTSNIQAQTPYATILQAAHSRRSTSPTTATTAPPKIHACFNQTVVRTGRLSCCRPNLQSMPNAQLVRGVDLNIRSYFTASPG